MKYSKSLLVSLTLALFSLPLYPSIGSSDAPQHSLKSGRNAGQVDRVTTVLQVTGDVIQPVGPKGQKTEKRPINVVCNRDYDEKTLDAPVELAGKWRSVRYYDKATATVKEGKAVEKPVLRPDRSLVCAVLTGPKSTLFCPRGSLNEEESELVGAVGNSLVLDQFLPAGEVELGQKWKTSDQALAVLLDLEEVTSNKVETRLKEVNAEVARLELEGKIEGKSYGASAQLEVKAKCRFDLKTQRIDWFAMWVKQNRQASLVLKALDVTLLLQIQVKPKAESPQLTDAALKGLSLEPTDDPCQVCFQPAEGGWQLEHDRTWFLFDHHRDLTILYMLDRGQQTAFCRASPLPRINPEKLISLARFQEDVKQALDKRFGSFFEAAESTSEPGYRIYRVVAKGQEGELPVVWHYYLITDQQGRQMSMVFGLDEKKADQFGKAGERLVKGLQFVEAKAK